MISVVVGCSGVSYWISMVTYWGMASNSGIVMKATSLMWLFLAVLVFCAGATCTSVASAWTIPSSLRNGTKIKQGHQWCLFCRRHQHTVGRVETENYKKVTLSLIWKEWWINMWWFYHQHHFSSETCSMYLHSRTPFTSYGWYLQSQGWDSCLFSFIMSVILL